MIIEDKDSWNGVYQYWFRCPDYEIGNPKHNCCYIKTHYEKGKAIEDEREYSDGSEI
jgi:hypothetical protein